MPPPLHLQIHSSKGSLTVQASHSVCLAAGDVSTAPPRNCFARQLTSGLAHRLARAAAAHSSMLSLTQHLPWPVVVAPPSSSRLSMSTPPNRASVQAKRRALLHESVHLPNVSRGYIFVPLSLPPVSPLHILPDSLALFHQGLLSFIASRLQGQH